MATKTKAKPKSKKRAKANKPKLRGGNSDKAADEPLIQVPESTAEQPSLEQWKASAPEGQEALPAEGDSQVREILDPSKAYDSPEALAIWDAETASEAEQRRRKRAELWEKEDASKAAHKADKAAAEEYEKQFFDWLRERNEQRGKPPQPKQGTIPYPDPEAKVDPPDLPLAPAENDERWKAIPLTELVEKDGFPAYLVEKLANATRKDDRPQAPITTLGELTQFQEPEGNGYQKKLTDLVGIGPGAAEKIANACMAFWDRWAKEEAARRLEAKPAPAGELVDAEFEVIPDEGEDDEVEEPDDDLDDIDEDEADDDE